MESLDRTNSAQGWQYKKPVAPDGQGISRSPESSPDPSTPLSPAAVPSTGQPAIDDGFLKSQKQDAVTPLSTLYTSHAVVGDMLSKGSIEHQAFHDAPPSPQVGKTIDLTSPPLFLRPEKEEEPGSFSSKEPSMKSFSGDERSALSSSRRLVMHCELLKEMNEITVEGGIPDGDELAALLKKADSLAGDTGDPVTGLLAARLRDSACQTLDTLKATEKRAKDSIPLLGAREPMLYFSPLEKELRRDYHDSSLVSFDEASLYFRSLQKKTRRGPISEETLRTTAHLARELHQMKECYDNRQRAREMNSNNSLGAYPSRLDRMRDLSSPDHTVSYELVKACTYLVDQWWKRGQIEVRMDGRTIPYGSQDVASRLIEEHVPLNGSVIELETPSGERHSSVDGDSLNTQKEGIFFKNTLREKQEAFLDLMKKEPEKAGAIVRQAVEQYRCSHPLTQSLDYRHMETILQSARDDSAVRDFIKPFVEPMKGFTREAELRGALDLETVEPFVTCFKALVSAYPELLDGDFMRNTAVPLLLAEPRDQSEMSQRTAERSRDFVSDILKARPDLVDSTMEAILSAKGKPCLSASAWSILDEGARIYGWEPHEGKEKDMLAARLTPPPDFSTMSIFENDFHRDTDFLGATRLLRSLKEKNPGAEKGIMVPQGSGAPLSVENALVERVIADPMAMRCTQQFAYPRSVAIKDSPMEDVFVVIDGSHEAAGYLLKAGEKAREKGAKFDFMSDRNQAALLLLANTEMSGEDREKRNALLGPMLYEKSESSTFQFGLEDTRNEEAERLKASLSSGALMPDETLGAASRLINLALCANSYQHGIEDHMKDYLPALEKALAQGLERADFAPAVTSLIESLRTRVADAGRIGYMSVPDIAGLCLLQGIGEKDRQVKESLEQIIMPEFSQKCDDGENSTEASVIKRKFVVVRSSEHNEIIGRTGIPRSERLALIGENERMSSYYDGVASSEEYRALQKETFDAFSQALKSGGTELADLPGVITDPRTAYRVYRTLAPGAERDEEIAPEWAKLRGILTALGGEKNLDKAIDAYCFAKKEEGAGHSWEQLEEHLYTCLALGENYREVPIKGTTPVESLSIEDFDEDMISIGGVRLQVKNEE